MRNAIRVVAMQWTLRKLVILVPAMAIGLLFAWRGVPVANAAATAGAAVLGMIATMFNASPAHGAPASGPQSVLVVNGSSQPIPTTSTGTTAVSGNVGITGTPTVNAAQSGNWNVGISGTPAVSV